jgi:hypothetical protein
VILSGLLALVLGALYVFAQDLPLSAQRSASFLPGIQVEQSAKNDAMGTWECRKILRKIGLEMAPQYFWVGRGFSHSGKGDFSMISDPTGITMHVNMGRFYNGFVGLLVNVGGFGTLFMLVFLTSGLVLSGRIMQHLRAHGCNDLFSLMCSVVSAQWAANTVAFLFLHGDSEWAMKTFSLQAGLLLACDFHLKNRLKA